MFPIIVTFVTILMASLSAAGQAPKTPAPAPAAMSQFRMPPRIVSPEILPDNEVTFKVFAVFFAFQLICFIDRK